MPATKCVLVGNWEMVFCYQNCPDILWEKIILGDQEKLLKFEAEGQEFAKWDH